jgi:serine/threonine protein kinase
VVGDRYQLQTEIGQGAMGSVWRAVHVKLQRPFAVKFLKPYADDPNRMLERFFREARLAAAVSHRFVVDIVDYGTTDEGTPFLVMEYLRGEPLDDRLRRDPPLKVRDLVRMMGQVVEGLAAVHRAGIVHRDIKPDNILLTCEGDSVFPKLVDFSISREESARQEVVGRPTPVEAPTAMGTPWYMSPEQADGRLPVDRRSDIFSAGVVLYEALTGTAPFDGPDLESVVAAVALGTVTPLAVMRADLGDELCSIVDTALARNPEERHRDAATMAAALFAAIGKVPDELTCPRLPPYQPVPRRRFETFSVTAVKRAVLAGPRRASRTAVLPPRRRPMTRVALAAATLAVVTAAIYLGVPRAGARPEPAAVASSTRAGGQVAVVAPDSPQPPGGPPPSEHPVDRESPAIVAVPPPEPPRHDPRRAPRREGPAPALFRNPGF